MSMPAGNDTSLQMLAKVEASSRWPPAFTPTPVEASWPWGNSYHLKSLQFKGSNNYRQRENGDEAPTSPARCNEGWGPCSCQSQRPPAQGKSRGLLLLIPTSSCFISLAGLWNQRGALLEINNFTTFIFPRLKIFSLKRATVNCLLLGTHLWHSPSFKWFLPIPCGVTV